MISPSASLHPLASVDPDAHIGPRSRIWQFCVILPGAVIGDDCNISTHCLIEGGARLGNRVTVKSGIHLWDQVVVEDDVFIGPGVAFTNDLHPRSRRRPARFASTLLRQGCSLGANSTILPVTIGRFAMVGAGAVVTKNVADFALVTGNPAKFRAWVCRCGAKLQFGDGGLARCACGLHFEKSSATTLQESPHEPCRGPAPVAATNDLTANHDRLDPVSIPVGCPRPGATCYPPD